MIDESGHMPIGAFLITSRKNQVPGHFDRFSNYMLQQDNFKERKHFVWTIRSNLYQWQSQLNHHLEGIYNSLLDNETEAMAEQRDMLPNVCRSVRMTPSNHVTETARQVQQAVLQQTGCQHFGYLHLRRGDAKNDCDTSLKKMKDYLACTFNSTASALGKLPLLFSSDETSQSYRSSIKSLIDSVGKLRFVDLDNLLRTTLKEQVAKGEIPASKLNNYLTFYISSQIKENAVLKLARRRKIICNECDNAIVEVASENNRASPSGPVCP